MRSPKSLLCGAGMRQARGLCGWVRSNTSRVEGKDASSVMTELFSMYTVCDDVNQLAEAAVGELKGLPPFGAPTIQGSLEAIPL